LGKITPEEQMFIESPKLPDGMQPARWRMKEEW